jgi:hypothetical protein
MDLLFPGQGDPLPLLFQRMEFRHLQIHGWGLVAFFLREVGK